MLLLGQNWSFKHRLKGFEVIGVSFAGVEVSTIPRLGWILLFDVWVPVSLHLFDWALDEGRWTAIVVMKGLSHVGQDLFLKELLLLKDVLQLFLVFRHMLGILHLILYFFEVWGVVDIVDINISHHKVDVDILMSVIRQEPATMCCTMQLRDVRWSVCLDYLWCSYCAVDVLLGPPCFAREQLSLIAKSSAVDWTMRWGLYLALFVGCLNCGVAVSVWVHHEVVFWLVGPLDLGLGGGAGVELVL